MTWSRPASLRVAADCKNDKSSNIKIELIDESPFHLKGSFPGPQDTPYEGGHFEVVSTVHQRSSLRSTERVINRTS